MSTCPISITLSDTFFISIKQKWWLNQCEPYSSNFGEKSDERRLKTSTVLYMLTEDLSSVMIKWKSS